MQGAVSRLQGSPTERGVGQFRQLLADRWQQPLVGHDQRLRGRDQVAEPIDRLPDHRLLAHQREQLLGHVGPAGGPESRAGAAGHDDCVEHGGVLVTGER